jgi:hypothetical protein
MEIDDRKLHGKLVGLYGGYEDNTHHKRIWWEIDGVEYGGVDIRHGAHGITGKDLSHIKRKLNLERTMDIKDIADCTYGKENLMKRLVSCPPLGL